MPLTAIATSVARRMHPFRGGNFFEGRPAVAGKCDVCGKAKTFGKNVSFSKRRTNRDFKPNVQSKKIVVNGVGIRLHICTRCLRTMGKSGKVAA
jgi:large subunit ribosomal protein L28